MSTAYAIKDADTGEFLYRDNSFGTDLAYVKIYTSEVAAIQALPELSSRNLRRWMEGYLQPRELTLAVINITEVWKDL
jgi:hypothetical protein